jgi:hypothetical protein
MEAAQMVGCLLAGMKILLKADHEDTMAKMKVHHEEMMTVMGAGRGGTLFTTFFPTAYTLPHFSGFVQKCKHLCIQCKG